MTPSIHRSMTQHISTGFPSRKRLYIVLLMFAVACAEDEPVFPTVNTLGVVANDATGVTLKGELADLGQGVIEHGFFYGSTSVTDDTGNYSEKISLGSSNLVGDFTAIANKNLIKDQTYYYRAYVIAKVDSKLILGQEFTFVSRSTSPPVITDFTPASGKKETLITINGSNFHPVKENNQVWFGNAATGKKGEIVSASTTMIVVKPPIFNDTLINLTVKTSVESAPSANKFHFLSPWRRVKDLPANPRADATAFAVGNFGYVGLGNAPGDAKKFWKYDPSTDTWTEIAEFTTVAPVTTSSPFLDIVSFSTGTAGFVGVGDFTGGDRGTIAKYDPAQNKWTRVATFEDKVRNAIGFSINGKGYVGTGITPGDVTLPNLWEYDPALDKWTKKKDLPGVARYLANVFTIGSKAYVWGGGSCFCGISAWLRDLWEYDTSTDEWRSRASFPNDVLNPTTFAINGKGYLLGGVNKSNQLLSAFYEYDPALDQWKVLPDFPGGNRDGGVAFVINNKVYFGTGRSALGVQKKDFWEFDPSNY